MELTPPVEVPLGPDGTGVIDVAAGRVTFTATATDPDTGQVVSEQVTEHMSVEDARLFADALANSDDWRTSSPDPDGVITLPVGDGGSAVLEPTPGTPEGYTVRAAATDPDTGVVISEEQTEHADLQAAITYVETLRRDPAWHRPRTERGHPAGRQNCQPFRPCLHR